MVIDTGLILILLLVLGIFAYVHLIIGRQKAIWSEFAYRHGLGYEDPGLLRYPFVRGRIHDRSFELKVELVEMFSIRTGRSFMVMSLEIKVHFLCTMEIVKANTFPELQYLRPGPRFLTGDRSFDDRCEIFCPDKDACSRYLVPHRKTALQELFSLEGESRVSITNRGSHIVFRSQRIIKDAQKLDYLFTTLVRVAPDLDS
jgi:hypothetical protein